VEEVATNLLFGKNTRLSAGFYASRWSLQCS